MLAVGRNSWKSSGQMPSPAQAEPPVAGWPQPCPDGFGVSPTWETLGWGKGRWALRVLLQFVLLIGQPYSKNMFPGDQKETPVSQFAPTASCPATGYH